MKIRFFILSTLLFSLSGILSADLEIIVKSDPDWGPMKTSDVEYLCQNVVDHFEKHLRPENEINESVNIYRTNVGHNFATLDISDLEVRYKIGIQPIEQDGIGYRIKDFFYLIQPFAHEFLHILQDHSHELFDNEPDPNLWLMEGIATMSSIWVLREMASEWKNGSKFGVNLWQADGTGYNFSESFYFFANEIKKQHSISEAPEDWLEKYEDDLRKVSISKKSAGLHFPVPPEQLVFLFLPVFEENPKAWNIIPKMPFTKSKVKNYMQEWYNNVDEQDTQYVKEIADVMKIEIDSSKSIKLLADVNKDGYIDLSDVMIVRSGMQNTTTYDTDLNDDGVTDEADLLIVKMAAMEAIIAASPTKRKVKITTWAKMKTERR